ncbi:MAG TPA: hypothetical protein VLZ83_01785 [Edaphocola sp.]|nr:hypothetical protein [Edaphocola sp.]
MRQYRFLEASWVLMIFAFIGVMILNAILVIKIQKTLDLPKNGFIGIIIITLIFLVPILVSRLISFSKTTVTLNKKEIQVKRSSLIGMPIKSDFELHYSQIDSYVFQDDQNWHWLKIKDLNGKVYRIWKFGWFKNKEFNAFRDQLTNEINWFNKEMTDTDQTERQKEQIKIAKNIYQGTSGSVLGIVSILIMFAIPILIFVFGMNKLSSLGPILIGLSGAIFTFFRVLNERKK